MINFWTFLKWKFVKLLESLKIKITISGKGIKLCLVSLVQTNNYNNRKRKKIGKEERMVAGTISSFFLCLSLTFLLIIVKGQELHLSSNASFLCSLSSSSSPCNFTDPRIWVEQLPSSFFNYSIFLESNTSISLYPSSSFSYWFIHYPLFFHCISVTCVLLLFTFDY